MTLPSGRHALAAALAALALLTLTPAAGIVYYLLPLAAAGGVAVLAARRDFVGAVQLQAWCWFLAPLVRRMVELRIGYQEQNVVLLAPVLACVPLAVAILFVRCALPRRLLHGLFALVSALLLGAVMAATQLTAVATVAGAATWLPPIVLGLAVLLLPIDAPRLRELLGGIGVWGALLMGGYGVVQWLVVPEWDAVWLTNVLDTATSFGRPVPREIRVFTTLNSPGPAAAALLLCAVLASTSPRAVWLRTVSVAAAVAALGLTQVRQVWLAAVLFLVVAAARRVYSSRAVAATVLAVVAVVVLVPAARESVGARVGDSVRAGTSDRSLEARVAFQASTLTATLARPVGLGLGSTGAGVRASDEDPQFGDVDSGYLELLRSLGALVTLVFLAGLVLVGTATRPARGDRVGLALGALCLTFPVQLLLGNLFVGATGAVSWLALFATARLALDSRRPASAEDPDPVRTLR